ncbi:hypothetical protein ASE79_18810 [Sphingomonas sp. Leaf28]|nr:hypothetical protein ASE79_18810 [Sphingomonas sp. Leaf28]
MLPYWLLFMLWSAGAVQTERRGMQNARLLFFVGATILTTLIIGLRFEVGGDWGAYQRMYNDIFFLSLPNALTTTDSGYAALNWLAAQIGLDITFVNLVCAMLFMSGLARLAWRQPNPALAILVAVPYFIIVVAMGYTRQAAAIGIICFAIADTSERHLIRLVILIGIAALFHKTAILILPIALVPVFRRNVLLGGIGILLFIILFMLLLRDNSDKLLTNYVQGDYDSQGAAIRAAMNVVPAVIFFILRKRIDLPPFVKSFWATCAVLSIVSVFALATASASSGIDRLSLYIIPLQLVVYSRLPYILSSNGRAMPSILMAVVAYSFLVQFVWLNYAQNVEYWLPYTASL